MPCPPMWNMTFANISRAVSSPTALPAPVAMNVGMTFSLPSLVKVEADDRAGLERLLRYCARPIFAMERLTWVAEDRNRLVYQLPKPMPDGR
jgi:hypothetical protein